MFIFCLLGSDDYYKYMRIQDLQLRSSSHYNSKSKKSLGQFWLNHKKLGYIANNGNVIKTGNFQKLQAEYYKAI